MSSFDKYTNYDKGVGVSGVIFGADKPVLEVEMNELQEIQNYKLSNALRKFIGNGVSDKSKINYETGTLTLKDCSFIVDGYIINCKDVNYKCDTTAKIYLQVWEEDVDYKQILKEEGYDLSNETKTNYFKDSRSPQETSKRKVVKYTLSQTEDPSKHNLLIVDIVKNNLYKTWSIMCDEINLSLLTNKVGKRVDTHEGCLGLHVDLENFTFTRVGDNRNWKEPSSYNQSPIYGGRKLCLVTDNAEVISYNVGYEEDGVLKQDLKAKNQTFSASTKVQTMVYQPKFYYKREVIKKYKEGDVEYITEYIDYISPVMREGFRTHPAFLTKTGLELQGYLIGAYEGGAEINNVYFDRDENNETISTIGKATSNSKARPLSGSTNNLSFEVARKLCKNRGNKWQQLDINILSAEQLLFTIEYATYNIQDILGNVETSDKGWSYPTPNERITRFTGRQEGLQHGSATYNQVVYRGVVNPYGNIGKYIDNLSYTDELKYDGTTYDIGKTNMVREQNHGYISNFLYNEKLDWITFPKKLNGSSLKPVGDYCFFKTIGDIFFVGKDLQTSHIGSDISHEGIFAYGTRNKSMYSKDVGFRLCSRDSNIVILAED